jgi:hypothetical protein
MNDRYDAGPPPASDTVLCTTHNKQRTMPNLYYDPSIDAYRCKSHVPCKGGKSRASEESSSSSSNNGSSSGSAVAATNSSVFTSAASADSTSPPALFFHGDYVTNSQGSFYPCRAALLMLTGADEVVGFNGRVSIPKGVEIPVKELMNKSLTASSLEKGISSQTLCLLVGSTSEEVVLVGHSVDNDMARIGISPSSSISLGERFTTAEGRVSTVREAFNASFPGQALPSQPDSPLSQCQMLARLFCLDKD